MSELAKFDVSTIAEKLKERIRAEVSQLIPDEMFKAMIEQEARAFMMDREVSRHWHSDTVTIPCHFKQVVREVLTEETKRRAKEMLDSPEWKASYDYASQKNVYGEALIAAMKEAAPEIAVAVFKNAVAQTVQNMGYQLR